MQTKRIWLFSAHLLPLVARLCLVPLETIVFINKFSMIFTGLEVIYFLASNLLVPYNLAKTAYRELAQVNELAMWLNVASIFLCQYFNYSSFLICNNINLHFSLFPHFCISLSRSPCLALCPPGCGSVWPASFGNVSMEPAGASSSLHVFLATAVRTADLLLLQHQRSAYLKREAPFPLSYQVRPLHIIDYTSQTLWSVFCIFIASYCVACV